MYTLCRASFVGMTQHTIDATHPRFQTSIALAPAAAPSEATVPLYLCLQGVGAHILIGLKDDRPVQSIDGDACWVFVVFICGVSGRWVVTMGSQIYTHRQPASESIVTDPNPPPHICMSIHIYTSRTGRR